MRNIPQDYGRPNRTGKVSAWLVAAVLGGAAAVGGDDALEGRHVTVTGEGSVRAQPDLAVASLGVSTHGASAAAAMAASRELMDAVLSAVTEAGVAGDDVVTTDFAIHRERVRPPGPRSGDGEMLERFAVRNLVLVTIRDLERAGQILDGIIDAGANEVRGIRFILEDDRAPKDRARELASLDARHRAEQLARLQGASLGRVLRISESGVRPVRAEAMMMRASDAGSSTVSAGDLTLSAHLQVVYELAD